MSNVINFVFRHYNNYYNGLSFGILYYAYHVHRIRLPIWMENKQHITYGDTVYNVHTIRNIIYYFHTLLIVLSTPIVCSV